MRTLDLIDAAFGFDFYILKVPQPVGLPARQGRAHAAFTPGLAGTESQNSGTENPEWE